MRFLLISDTHVKLGIVIYGMKGLAIALAVAIPISGLTMVISDKCGDLSGRLFLGPKSNRSVRERLSGNLSRARVQKMNGNYEEALSIIDNVLDQVAAIHHSPIFYIALRNPKFANTFYS